MCLFSYLINNKKAVESQRLLIETYGVHRLGHVGHASRQFKNEMRLQHHERKSFLPRIVTGDK